jgi:hypothetical protein
VDDEDSLSMDFVFSEDTRCLSRPEGRVGHPDLTQKTGQTRAKLDALLARLTDREPHLRLAA